MEEKSFLQNLKTVLLNAFLLLIPSAIFIIVKVNTIKNTITWKFENIIIFFILYVIILSVFTFQPHVKILQIPKVQTSLKQTNDFFTQLLSISWVKLALLSLFLVLPWLLSLYYIKVFIYTFVFLLFAIGLNYTVGYTGILNLGHVLPFAAGAYAYGVMYKFFQFGFFYGLVFGAILGLLVGWLISVITLRLNGDYLAIVTLALAEIFKIVMNNLDFLTGGARGIPGIPLPTLFGLPISFIQKYIVLYYVTFGLVIVGIILATRLIKSRFGRSWEAIREDTIAAESMGISLYRVRMIVFAIGGCYAGIAGVLLTSSSTYVSPSVVGILYSITVLSIIVLGGMGSITGVILGTIIVAMVPEFLRFFELYRMLIYGGLLVVMMRYRQRGLFPLKRIVYEKPSDMTSPSQSNSTKEDASS